MSGTITTKENSAENTSIQLTTRHERTLYTHLIHLVISPFRSRLGRPRIKQPEGAVKLTPPRSKCNIDHRSVCDIHVYDICSKTAVAAECKKHIYYFCGGGWQSPPSGQHWQLCACLAIDVPGTIVSLVAYPLAPRNPAPKTVPWLLRFYREVMRVAEEKGEKVILAGDSSGGNIALCLALEALHEDAESENVAEGKTNPHPIALLAICPSTDMTRSNPDIENLAKVDPILTPSFVRSTASRWTGGWDPSDRRISPVNADISLLVQNNIHVHGITAGYDVLSPDAIIFRGLCAEAGVEGKWLHWEKQMHCFVLTAGYWVPEAKEAVNWAIETLKNE
ncbi:alpha/beta-hydrolase [Massarina eburnea CBS 473.64]|uniref:Alpha/beta-hydrolase n=1 Tax=Massarina eburnea CBS 473.64 TaxID=1395130 RepID=A0A6A6SFW3_9PLEO|nr:alpha/beta-hydrolase [Massarina eburnea CBS 473.64]